jgi:cyanophycinase-like exopeptidase
MKHLNYFLIFLLTSSVSCLSLAQDFVSYFTGNQSDAIVSPAGGVFLAGGASDHDNAMRWFLQQCNGGDVVVLRASGTDGYNDYFYSDLGVAINSVESIVFTNRNASFDAAVLAKINRAEGVFFAGGDQWNYVSYWRNSPVDSLLNKLISDRKIVIGGTSAGMAILGGSYFSAEYGSVTTSEVLSNPDAQLVAVDTTRFLKVPFLENYITDTHYDNPDRRGRHVGFLAKSLVRYQMPISGLACNEYVAVCIDSTGKARVFGEFPTYEEYAYFIHPNCSVSNNQPEVFQANLSLTWNHMGKALQVYKVPGTLSGEHHVDMLDESDRSGGSWLFWSVNEGAFVESLGEEVSCNTAQVTSNSLKNVLVQNPFHNTLSITSSESINALEIYSLSGKLLLKNNAVFDTHFTAKSNEWQIGIYFLKLELSSGAVLNYKLLKEF